MSYQDYDFVGSYNKGYVNSVGSEVTINMYEIDTPSALKKKALIYFPGSILRVSLGIEATSACRGSFQFTVDGIAFNYYVFGQFVYRFETDLSFTLIGTLNTTIGHVDIEANLTELLFVDGSDGWVWNGSAFTQVTDSNFPANPVSVTYLDGRFLVSSNESNQFASSAQEDGLTWPPLETAEMNTKGDTIVKVKMLKRRIYVFGNIITEEWYDGGSPGFPFVRDNSILYGFGLASIASLAGNEDVLLWVSKTKQGSSYIMMTDGGEVRKVSTPAIDLLLQQISRRGGVNTTGLSDGAASIMEINGQIFYILSFTGGNSTLLYNITTDKWSLLSMLDGSRYYGQYHTYFNNRHYIGSFNSPNLYEVSRNYFTNNGEAMKFTRISKIIGSPTGMKVEIKMLELQFDQGNYLRNENDDNGIYFDNFGSIYTNNQSVAYWNNSHNTSPEVSTANPVVYISTSSDGGNTYGYERVQPLGNVGEFNARTIWNDFGIGDSFVVKMESYSSIPLIILGGNIDYEFTRFGA